MTNARETFGSLRSILEVPLTSDRFWPRIAELQADAIMLDLEDSAAPDQKEAARAALGHLLAQPGLFRGRPVFVRINGLNTPWGTDDLVAVAACPAPVMICYPKIEHEDELTRAQTILAANGLPRKFYVMIESHAGLARLDAILSRPDVVGVHFGYTDYALAVGCPIFNEAGDDFRGLAMQGPRARIGAAAAGHGVFATGGTLIPDYRDDEKVARFIRAWRMDGYSACLALAPRHLELIHRNIRPDQDEVAAALQKAAHDGGLAFLDRRMAEILQKQQRGY